MGPIRVVEAHVLREDHLQVLLAEHEHVVEALLAEGADDPLGDGVGNRCRLRVRGTLRGEFGSSIPTIR
jgi:hypothetical protein